jgi:rhodanese-related sulfurtransferase
MFRGPRVPSVSVDGVPADAFLLDVREDDEWVAGHAPGAHHVPMMQVPGRVDEVPNDRDVVVICRVGSRSAQVVAFLQANGWGHSVNLDGGMHKWAAAGKPMVSEDGSDPRVA